MMNRENVRQWTAALRSPEYTQCIGQYCTDGDPYYTGPRCHCAIGLGIQVYLDAHDITADNPHIDIYDELCDDAMKWYGIRPHQLADVMQMNDKHGMTFAQIANVIDSYAALDAALAAAGHPS